MTDTATPAAAAPDVASNGVVVAGYVTAFAIPLIGFVVGIVLMAKRRMGHGIAVMVVSVVFVFVWAGVLLNQASNDANNAVQQYNQQVQDIQNQSDSYANCLAQAMNVYEEQGCNQQYGY